MVVSAPRCTPPMPPVANTRTPAIWARIMVAATVVAPSWPEATSRAMSRRLALVTAWPALPRYSSCSGSSPTHSFPPRMAQVAGTAPFSRMMASQVLAVSTFWGYGMPWEMMVLSRATTGLFSARAAATSLDNFRYGFIGNILHSWVN